MPNALRSQVLRDKSSENIQSLPLSSDDVLIDHFATASPEQIQENLAAAFQFFNETSAQLSASYQCLEARVGQLTQELQQVDCERQEEQSRHHELSERMSALLDFLPGGVIVLDSLGYVIQSNPSARDMLEHSLDGSLWREVIKQCFAPRSDDGLEVSTHTGRRVSIATSSLASDGQIILLTDQTETRELQKKVSRYERLSALGKMVSALAHQIRTPLSAAMLYVDHLRHDELTQARKNECIEKLSGRLNHMERQVRDMLLFVKSELPLNDKITLADLQRGLLEAVEVPLQNCTCDFDLLNHCPQTLIQCHREALISALVNLVNNTIQACQDDFYLRITFTKEDENSTIRIAIEDNGPGIDEAIADHVTDLFVTTKAQGTGLGLAVVKAVARAHGGRFEVSSSATSGTTAQLVLPIAKA